MNTGGVEESVSSLSKPNHRANNIRTTNFKMWKAANSKGWGMGEPGNTDEE